MEYGAADRSRCVSLASISNPKPRKLAIAKPQMDPTLYGSAGMTNSVEFLQLQVLLTASADSLTARFFGNMWGVLRMQAWPGSPTELQAETYATWRLYENPFLLCPQTGSP